MYQSSYTHSCHETHLTRSLVTTRPGRRGRAPAHATRELAGALAEARRDETQPAREPPLGGDFRPHRGPGLAEWRWTLLLGLRHSRCQLLVGEPAPLRVSYVLQLQTTSDPVAPRLPLCRLTGLERGRSAWSWPIRRPLRHGRWQRWRCWRGEPGAVLLDGQSARRARWRGRGRAAVARRCRRRLVRLGWQLGWQLARLGWKLELR